MDGGKITIPLYFMFIALEGKCGSVDPARPTLHCLLILRQLWGWLEWRGGEGRGREGRVAGNGSMWLSHCTG